MNLYKKLRNQNVLPRKYTVDAFPVSACRNIRIRNCRIYQGENFRGYNFSKREWFYGLKVTLAASRDGCPLRVMLCPGAEKGSVPFKLMNLRLPKGSELYGDSAYVDDEHKTCLKRSIKYD